MNFEKQAKLIAASIFAIAFLIISGSMVCLAVYHFYMAVVENDFVSGVIKSINDLFIALATYELAIGIYKEYSAKDDSSIIVSIRKTIARFVGVVIIALVLEGLIMIIKYSQLELAGNMLYPVLVILSAALLLLSLGIFLKFSDKVSGEGWR